MTKRSKKMSAQHGRDNPYLAHLQPSQRGANVSVVPTAKEPLSEFMPRKVTGAQALKAMVCFNSLFKLEFELKF